MPRAVCAAPGLFTCIAEVYVRQRRPRRGLGASGAETAENLERSIGIASHSLERPRGCSQIGQRGTRLLDTEASQPSHRSSLKALGFSLADRQADRESIAEIHARQFGCCGTDEQEVAGRNGALKSSVRAALARHERMFPLRAD
jgi:hypothetical protein